MKTKGIKKVATLCVLKNEKYFLLLKRYNEPNKNMYVPVGGKLKAFETPVEGVVRETKEETGIHLHNPTLCGVLTESSPIDYNWISYIFCQDIDMIIPPESEEGILEWIKFKDISRIPTPKTDHFIYEFILKNKKFIIDAQYDKNLNLISMREEITDQSLK